MRGAIIFIALFFFTACVLAKNKLTGINLSGAAFASDKKPGKPGYDYFFPTQDHMDYFLVTKKMNVVRFPILWERIQPSANSALDTVYCNSLVSTVKYVTETKGKYLILDVHNYQRYYGEFVGETVPTSNLLDLYTKLYALLSPYKEKVIWGIMNEPEGKDYKKWAQISQEFINHMRKIGSSQLLLIPGLSYTGAGSWGNTDNYHEMWNLTDPLNNFAMEIHMYHDSDSSGTHDICSSATVGVARMNYVTDWMRAYSRKAFLGETGAARNDLCYSAITNTLDFMSDNDDVWLGWTWWAGGHGWGDYPYTLTPFDTNNQDPPQWPYITPYVADSVPTPSQIQNEVKNYPRTGDVKIPIYNGRLNMVSNPSWAPNTEKDATKTYSSPFSYSFTAGGSSSNAIQWTCNGCFDTTLYSGLEFYIATTGSLSDLRIRMIDYNKTWSPVPGESSVQALAKGSADSRGWTRCFMNFSNYDGERHGGFMIWSGPVRPIAYLDAVSLIHHFDSDFVSPLSATSTTGKSSSSTTTGKSTTSSPSLSPSTTAKSSTTSSSPSLSPSTTTAKSSTASPSSTTAKTSSTPSPPSSTTKPSPTSSSTTSPSSAPPSSTPSPISGDDRLVSSSSSSLDVFGVSFLFMASFVLFL